MVTIGFLELNSIVKGIQAADQMVKAAAVELLHARPGCPGKFQILITGEVAAVDAALQAGEETAKIHVIDRLTLPRIHPQVIEAIHRSSTIPEPVKALGALEFFSVTASILAADAAVKAAHITLIEIRLGTGIGGRSFVTFCGDISAVEASAAAGVKSTEGGDLIEQIVIANPDPQLVRHLL